MLKYLKRIYTRLWLKNERKKKHTRAQMENYLHDFGEPKDDIERSFFQYCCQQWITNGRMIFVIANMVSIFLYFPYYCYYRFNNKRAYKKAEYPFIATNASILQSIPDEYASKCLIPDFNRGVLTEEDSSFLKEISYRYPWAFYFRFKIMCRIANYSYIIQCFSPKMIFCSAEYSYTSSILTLYCEEKKVEHNNAMHGEKIFNIRDSFSRFTKCYVWDEFYKLLFLSLRADKTEYIIKPLKVPRFSVEHKESNYTYYLQAQTLEQLKVIKKKFESMNVNYKVRCHPLYTTEDIRQVFDEKHIESNRIDIWDSIKYAGHVVSIDSTVNYQAYLAGVKVVLDDISDPIRYKNSLDSGYIMHYKPHVLFSKLE